MSSGRDAGSWAASKRASNALARASLRVDRALRHFIDRQPLSDFCDLVRYQLGWDGSVQPPQAKQHLPAALVLLVSEACGHPSNAAMPFAVCIGLMHEFGAIQADLEAQQTRHGRRPTVWKLWGRAQAMNAADGVHALAKVALLEGQHGLSLETVLRLAETIDECWLSICESAHERMQRRQKVPERIELAVLCGCAAHGGCLVAGLDAASCAALRDFGGMVGRVAAGRHSSPASYRRALATLQSAGVSPGAAAQLAGLTLCQLALG